MSSLGRSVFALVARRSTLPPSSFSVASSFASSSRVRLDSTPFLRAEAPSPSPLDDASAQALDNALNTNPSSSSSNTPPPPPITTPNPTSARTTPPPSASSKSKYRVPPPLTPIAITNDESLYTLTVTCTRNNTTLTFSDHTGPLFPTISGGTDKTFKNSQRASYEAAHQAALKMFAKMEDYSRSTGQSQTQQSTSSLAHRGRVFTPQYAQSLSMMSGIGSRRVKVVFSGLRGGQGREAVANAISGQEGDGIKQFIGRVEDRTGIKIGGTRGKKRRRL